MKKPLDANKSSDYINNNLESSYKIDLHVHSTASDGSFSPIEIINIAKSLDLKALAITDHDTLDGSNEALNYLKNNKNSCEIEFATGIEISANFSNFSKAFSVHILGYFIDLDNLELNKNIKILQEARKNRNPQIIKRLNSLKINISLQELINKFGTSQIGRPHIANLMINKGFVSSVDEAFDKYLATNRPAYVEKFKLDCQKAIEVIKNSGGVAILAHPGLIKYPDSSPDSSLDSLQEFDEFIKILKSIGLDGIEIYYPKHSDIQTRLYCQIAKKYNLLITGGTDFHGTTTPDIQIGKGKGDLFVPYSLFKALKAFISK